MPDFKPNYGSRLFAHCVAEIARDTPDRGLFIVPNDSKTYSRGFREVTYRDFNRSIDRLAWWLDENLGKSNAIDTLAYVGPNDLRYFILAAAVPKARRKLLLTSPRNSLPNHLHLIAVTDCSVFLKAASWKIDHVVRGCPTPLQVLDLPELDDLLKIEHVPEYPFPYAYHDIEHDEVIILHSSGTTGQVKPIRFTHRYAAAFDNHHALRCEGQRAAINNMPKGYMVQTMPFFHGAALLISCFGAVWYELPTVIYPFDAPVSVAGLVECIAATPARSAMLAPSTIEEIAQSPKALDTIEKLELIVYGGGGVTTSAADAVAQHTRLQSIIGASEHGMYPTFLADREDYEYVKFDPEQEGIEFRPVNDGVCELVFVRRPNATWNHTFEHFADRDEMATSDLWRHHPTKPGLWKHAGRSDDVIVLLNGEKVTPSLIEQIIGDAPEVRDILLYGAKRFAVAAIIEPAASFQHLSQEELIARLTPYIDRANKETPTHAQLSKDHVVFTSPEKPMLRLPKGTVARKATLTAYELELDEVYSKSITIKTPNKPLLKDANEDQTIEVLGSLVGQISELPFIAPDQDLFQAGVDSLQVITLLRYVKAILTAEGADQTLDHLTTALVYANPSVRSLAKALRDLGHKPDSEAQLKAYYGEVQSLVEKYTANMPAPSPGTPSAPAEFSVILTGSTGSLGSYLLDTLVSDSRVARIFCLNRSVDSRAKQLESSSTRSLPTTWGERVHFLHADLSQPQLGLDAGLYDRIVACTTHVMHNAWPVNFNLPLRTFEPHMRGVRRLVDFAAVAPHRPCILFTSSIGAVMNWGVIHPDEPVPEAEIADARVVASNGYSASKYVGERILSAAAGCSGLASAIVRVGQLAGSVHKTSVWNRWEWFPSILISGRYLGVLPATLGRMNSVAFVPVDRGAAVLWELATGDDMRDRGAHFYNMVNPHTVQYEELLPTLVETLQPTPKLVSFEEWVERLETSSKGPDTDPARNPGIKLLAFFKKGLVKKEARVAMREQGIYITEKTRRASKHMRELGPVKPEWMKVWVKGWGLDAADRKGDKLML